MQSQVAYVDSSYNADSSEVILDTTLNMERSIVEYITCSNQTKEQLKLKYPGWDSIVTENEPKGYQYEKIFIIVLFSPTIQHLIGLEIILDLYTSCCRRNHYIE